MSKKREGKERAFGALPGANAPLSLSDLRQLSADELMDGVDLAAAWQRLEACGEESPGDSSLLRAPALLKNIPARRSRWRAATPWQRKVALQKAARPPTSTVFIAYTRKDRAVANDLATYLEARGVQVWWDHEFYPGDNFHDLILQALDGAKAVIVIMSNDAARSPWVRDEARRAAKQGKLITLHVPTFDPKNLPLGLGDQPLVSVGDRDRLMGKLISSSRQF